MNADVADAQTPLTAYVAEEILALMGRRRMNKAELARRLGCDETWIGKRLNGRITINLDDLQRIAPILGVEVTALLPKGATTREWPSRDPLEPRVVATIGEPSRRPARVRHPHGRRSRTPATPVAA
jgi:transcriptional regulator with XRE-family HTH domain